MTASRCTVPPSECCGGCDHRTDDEALIDRYDDAAGVLPVKHLLDQVDKLAATGVPPHIATDADLPF